jgi:hypothetical protein
MIIKYKSAFINKYEFNNRLRTQEKKRGPALPFL